MSTDPPDFAAKRRHVSRFTVVCLMLIYFCSGACSLIDEVIWTRLLKLIIGNTVYASSIVISVFMGGLALGALLMGRFADRVQRPLRLYGLIELVITATALLSPWVLSWTDKVYLAFCRLADPSSQSLLFGHILLTSIILSVPTILMGSTLPLLGRVVARIETDVGPLVGRLYALNTLGAAAGCFLAGFIFIRLYGIMGSLFIAGGLNLAVALGGLLLHGLTRRAWAEPPKVTAPAPPRVVKDPGDRIPGGWILVMLGCFLSGLISIGYELLWMRSIVHSVGAWTYVFSAVLTVYLFGNVIGTAIGSFMVKRLRDPASTFAILLFGLGLCGLYYVPWLKHSSYEFLPEFVESVKRSRMGERLPWTQLGPMAQCFVLFIVPSIIMGMGFPLLLQAWVNRAHRIGWSTAAVYSTNTFGAVTGGLVTGFILLPNLGLQRSITWLGLLALWFACLLWLAFFRTTSRWWLKAVPIPVAAILITVHAGLVPKDLFTQIVSLNDRGQGYEVVAVKEGLNTTVSVHRDPKTDGLYLFTAGHRVAGDTRGYRGDQKMLGHFPVLLHPQCRRVLSVGFGSGESTACQSMHEPPLEKIACVEIAPEVVEASLKYFPTLNLGDALDEHVRMIFSDARHYLHLTEDEYDVIVSDCTSIRGFAENASLFTKDYFESARARLREGGMFMSWIDAYSTEAPEVIDSIIGSLMEVFPHVTLWYPTPEPASFFVIVGSDSPQKVDVAHIERELANKQVAESLEIIGIRSAMDVLSCYVGDEEDLKQQIGEYQTNSDYHPVVEFSTRAFNQGWGPLRLFFEKVRGRSLARHLLLDGLPQESQQAYRARLDRMHELSHYIQMAATATKNLDCLIFCARGLRLQPDNPALMAAREAAAHRALKHGLNLLKEGNRGGADSVGQTLNQVYPNSAVVMILLAHSHLADSHPAQATAAAQRALRLAPADVNVQFHVQNLLAVKEDLTNAKEILENALREGDSQSALKPAPLGF